MQTTDRNLQIFIDKYTIDKSTEDQSKTEFSATLAAKSEDFVETAKLN